MTGSEEVRRALRPPNQSLVSDWIHDTMDDWCRQAKNYLDSHPDEDGVIIQPIMTVGDETIELDPIPFIRKDLS